MAALLVAGLLASALGSLAVPASALAWDVNSFSAADEDQLFQLTNQARVASGLNPLRNDSRLHDLARWRSQDMIQRNYFSHNIPPSGETIFDVMNQQGIAYVVAGENIGWNTWPDELATAKIQESFMASAGHRANILNPSWTHMGIGAYKGADGKHMYTVIFIQAPGAAATPPPPPLATPGPTAPPAPARTASPTAAPTPAPTPTPEPTPEPTPRPSPEATDPPLHLPSGPTAAVPTVASPAAPPRGASLRVVDRPPARGLVDTIISDVLGSFFGL